MENWRGKVAVVTGCSSGIGAAIAVELAKHGLNVVGIARRVEKIQELSDQVSNAPGKIFPLKGDVSDIDSIVEAFKWIEEKFGKVHIVINNAGRFQTGTTLDLNLPHQEIFNTVNINFSGLVVTTREAYRLFQKHTDPAYIININSVAGHMSAAHFFNYSNVYSATKHAVTNHTDQVRLDIANSPDSKRIRVTSISPGAVKTEIARAAGTPKKAIEKLVDSSILDSKDIADAVIYLLSLPENVNITELTIKPTGEKF